MPRGGTTCRCGQKDPVKGTAKRPPSRRPYRQDPTAEGPRPSCQGHASRGSCGPAGAARYGTAGS
eukprot:5619965-Alexandrium_andersonii.AAC.1